MLNFISVCDIIYIYTIVARIPKKENTEKKKYVLYYDCRCAVTEKDVDRKPPAPQPDIQRVNVHESSIQS